MHDNATAVPRRQATRQGRAPEGNARMRCCKITRFVDFQARQVPFPGFASARMSPARLRLPAPIPRSFPSARPAATTGPRRSAHKLPIHPASSPKPAKTTRYAYTNHDLTRGNTSARHFGDVGPTVKDLARMRIGKMERRKRCTTSPNAIGNAPTERPHKLRRWRLHSARLRRTRPLCSRTNLAAGKRSRQHRAAGQNP